MDDIDSYDEIIVLRFKVLFERIVRCVKYFVFYVWLIFEFGLSVRKEVCGYVGKGVLSIRGFLIWEYDFFEDCWGGFISVGVDF